MRRTLIAALAVTYCSVPAAAMVFGGTNFSAFGGYPEHECQEPRKPYEPLSFNSQYEVDRYNDEVASYNDDLMRYRSCIREYVDNAENDIRRIQENAEAAISEANSL